MTIEYGVIKQRANHISYKDYEVLKELTYASKNLYNKAMYMKRQDFFANKAIRRSINKSKLSRKSKDRLLKRPDLRLMTYTELYHLMKNEPEYKVLNSNMSQQILKTVDTSFKSFFGLLRAKQTGSYKEKINLPNYLNKDGHFSLIIGFVRIKDNTFTLPMSNNYKNKRKITFNLPPILKDKIIKEIRVIPKQNARFFELQYVYEREVSNVIYNKNNALAIDLGINNLMTCATNDGKTFIIDGKRIKSVNQFANKENARLRSILDYQGLRTSRRLDKLWDKRNNIIHDYILKSCRYVVEYCKANDIGNIVLGFNKDMTRAVNLGKRNNQNVANLPMGKIKDTLTYMCRLENIELFLQEESYTSKASFWDKDPIKKCNYSGKRLKRGLYQTKDGSFLNADVNAALNILRKSNVVSLRTLYARGAMGTPVRIRLS